MKNTKKIKGHSRCCMALKDTKLSKKLILNLLVILILSLFFVEVFYADPNITVTKYTLDTAVTQNELVPFTLTIKNIGNVTINVTEVIDKLPLGLELVSYDINKLHIVYCTITN